jgi:hypothetical protein
MEEFAQAGARCIARFASGDAVVRYEIACDAEGLLCHRDQRSDDGGTINVTLPFSAPSGVRAYLDADTDLVRRPRLRTALADYATTHAAEFSACSSAEGYGAVDTEMEMHMAASRVSSFASLTQAHADLRAIADFIGLDGYVALLGSWGEGRRTRVHWLAGSKPAWCHLFLRCRWYLNSALLNHARRHDSPSFGSEVTATTPGQRAMREVSR